VSARDDYPPIPNGVNRAGGWGLLHKRMCDEIDRLRLALAWTERIAQDRGDENERLRARFIYKIGVERAVPHALASSASVSAVEQSATAHAAAPAGTEAPSP
jgi:hypothetical protein